MYRKRRATRQRDHLDFFLSQKQPQAYLWDFTSPGSALLIKPPASGINEKSASSH
jgi:hypothetical protein